MQTCIHMSVLNLSIVFSTRRRQCFVASIPAVQNNRGLPTKDIITSPRLLAKEDLLTANESDTYSGYTVPMK